MKNQEIAELLTTSAVHLREESKYVMAEIMLRRSLALYSNSSLLWSNFGVLLYNQDKLEEAEIAFKKSIELFQDEKDNSTPFTNYGILLANLKRDDEALAMFNEGCDREYKRVSSKWEIANLYLESGNWEEGFKQYEYRKLFKGSKYYPKLPYPLWDGRKNLNGKTLFVQPEQGMGDRILFSRYLIWLKNKYPDCKILYFCEPKEMNFFWEYRDYVELMPFGIPVPKADFGCFQLDLPGFHGTTIDNVVDDPGLFLKRIKTTVTNAVIPKPTIPSLKVGICWTGNPEQNLNHFRSIPLELMLQLAENPNVALHSLHIGKGQEDIERIGAQHILYDFSAPLKEKGYVGTGEIMMNMDLVVTCCTSVAHLAGVLKIPCMTLLCAAPFWVWLRERDDSVWYPKTMKLFRQPKAGDWESVIKEVKTEVDQLVEQKLPFLTQHFDK